MLQTKYPVFLLIFITTNMSRAKIAISDPHLDEEAASLAEGVITLLKSCYEDRITPVASAGELPDSLVKKLAIEHSIPVVSIDHTAKSMSKQYHVQHKMIEFRNGLQVFIVGASSVDKFHKILSKEISPSIWWNHLGSFVILDLGSRCKNYVPLLGIAWQFGILDATVMCFYRKLGRLIFTYNPYTNEAPSSWKRMFNIPGTDDHPFTVFYQAHEKNEHICKDLHFVKTDNLGGFKIRIFKYLISGVAHAGSSQTSRYFRAALYRLHNIISHAMNATLIYNIRPGGFRGDLDELQDLPISILGKYNYRMTYPHDRGGIILISKFRGHKSQLEKILTVIDFPSRCGLGIVYLITFIFFRFFLRQSSISAILNLVRITCDTGFENISRNNPTRIFLSTLLIFAVTMQGIYQGNLASLLTRYIPLRNVNTWNDTVDLGYHVYGGTKVWKLFIDNHDVLERYKEIEKEQLCVEYAYNDSLGACLASTVSYQLDQARELKMHASTETLEDIDHAFLIKWDWPLEQRLNTLLQRMFEADVLKPWPQRFNATELTEFQYDREVMENQDFKNIQLHEVLFAFVILGIGLVCATITFVGELVVHRFQCRVVTVKVQILN